MVLLVAVILCVLGCSHCLACSWPSPGVHGLKTATDSGCVLRLRLCPDATVCSCMSCVVVAVSGAEWTIPVALCGGTHCRVAVACRVGVLPCSLLLLLCGVLRQCQLSLRPTVVMRLSLLGYFVPGASWQDGCSGFKRRLQCARLVPVLFALALPAARVVPPNHRITRWLWLPGNAVGCSCQLQSACISGGTLLVAAGLTAHAMLLHNRMTIAVRSLDLCVVSAAKLFCCV